MDRNTLYTWKDSSTVKQIQLHKARTEPNSRQGGGECVGELRDVLSLSLSRLGKVEEEICLQASCPINTTEPAHFPLKTDISFWKKS